MKVLFISSGKKNGLPSPIVLAQAESIRGNGIQVNHYTIKRKGIKGYLKECHSLRKYLKEKHYDIIHAHYGLTAIVGLIARRKEKMIVSFMGDDIVGSRKPNGNITSSSLILVRLNAFLAWWFYDYSIVKSDQMHSKLQTNNVSLIPNGVNLELFIPRDKKKSRERLKIDDRIRLIIFISNPSRSEKNFTLAEKAVNSINDPNISLLPLFGVDHQNLIDYYSAADVLLLTSFHEGSPNVIKEAMACSTPIVSTDVGDVKWIIGNTEGCYISCFDPHNLALKIRLALDYSEKCGRTIGRDRIIELGLDSETIANRIIGVYQKVLKEN